MVPTYDQGWIKLYRKIIDSQVFQNEGLLKVWIWCLLKANHAGRWVPIKTGRGMTEVFVERGQFLFGRKSAAKELKMDEGTIYKRMMKLKNMENCNIESNTKYSIVTILNYVLYQGYPNDEVTSKVTTKEQPSNTNKNYKNEKKKRINSSSLLLSSSKGKNQNRQTPENLKDNVSKILGDLAKKEKATAPIPSIEDDRRRGYGKNKYIPIDGMNREQQMEREKALCRNRENLEKQAKEMGVKR